MITLESLHKCYGIESNIESNFLKLYQAFESYPGIKTHFTKRREHICLNIKIPELYKNCEYKIQIFEKDNEFAIAYMGFFENFTLDLIIYPLDELSIPIIIKRIIPDLQQCIKIKITNLKETIKNYERLLPDSGGKKRENYENMIIKCKMNIRKWENYDMKKKIQDPILEDIELIQIGMGSRLLDL